MTCWEFYNAQGVRMALIFSGAVAYLLYTELTRSGSFVYVKETRI